MTTSEKIVLVIMFVYSIAGLARTGKTERNGMILMITAAVLLFIGHRWRVL